MHFLLNIRHIYCPGEVGGQPPALNRHRHFQEFCPKKKPSHMEDFYFRVNTVISFAYRASLVVAMPGLIVLHQLRVHQLTLRLFHHGLPLFRVRNCRSWRIQ